jgi:hypothetical protein
MLGKDIKVRGGSTKRAVDILTNAISMYELAAIKAHKTRVARAFLNLVNEYQNDDVWSVEPIKKVPGYDRDGNIVDHTGMGEEKNEIKIKIDGNVHRVVAHNIHAKRVIKALKGDTINGGPVINALGRLNRILAMVNTSLSPEFMITNFSRDIQTAYVNMSDTEVSKTKWQVIKDVPKAMAGLKSHFRDDGTHKWAEYARLFEKSGAKIGWMDSYDDIKTKAKALEKQINLYRDGHKAQKTIHEMSKWVEDYNSIVENAVRLATFKNLMDNGVSVKKAAVAAKNLTVNFEQKGAYGQIFNSLYLFANAGIQGSAKTISVLARSPKARKIVYKSMAASAGIAFAGVHLGGDDEDGIPFYDKVPEYVRERNLVFMIPGSKGKFFSIPLPWGYNVFMVAGAEIGRAASGKRYSVIEGMTRIMNATMGAFNPLQSATLLQTLSPTVTDPIAQVGENTTWSGSPLMPENSPFDDVPKPDSELYWSSARKPSVWAAKKLNQLFGGNEIRSSGATDISPETLDMIYDTFTGSAGRFVADTAMLPVNAVTGDLELKNTPFVRRVFGTSSKYFDNQAYRNNIRHVLTTVEEIKKYPNNKYFLDDKSYTLYGQAKHSEAQLSRLNKYLKRNKGTVREQDIKEKIQAIKMQFNSKYYKTVRN